MFNPFSSYVEIQKRIAEKAKNKPAYDGDTAPWRPVEPQPNKIPAGWGNDFYEPSTGRNEVQTKTAMAKVLAFIECNKQRRFKEQFTVMPVPTTSPQYLSIWGSQRNVSNAIQFMTSLGLLTPYELHYSVEKKKCKTYIYSPFVEQKVKDYCAKNGINCFRVINAILKVGSANIDTLVETYENSGFSISEVKFSSKLFLLKPDNISCAEFENDLTALLVRNYPRLQEFAQLAEDLNEVYYADNKQFANRYNIHFTWNSGNKAVTKIGIRNTNMLCGAAKEDTLEQKKKNGEDTSHILTRKEILEKYNLTLHFDVKSSVPKITYLLNNNQWLNNSVDLYKEIAFELIKGSEGSSGGNTDTLVETYEFPKKMVEQDFNNKVRETFKSLYMRCNFDSPESIGANTRRAMAGQEDKDWVDQDMQALQNATFTITGKTYGSEVFFHESNVYLLVQQELLDRGFKVWQVYDSWYCDNPYNLTQEDFEEMVSVIVENCAYEYIAPAELKQAS